MQRKLITKHKSITILLTNQRVVEQLSSQNAKMFNESFPNMRDFLGCS